MRIADRTYKVGKKVNVRYIKQRKDIAGISCADKIRRQFMKKYEYKFIEIPLVPVKKEKAKTVRGEMPPVPFEACREAIVREAADGWRLKQILEPKVSVYGGNCYQIIFERETEE